MGVFLYIVVSPVNILQISPLFFLGSTLIFIGYDLMWEWLWEVRENIFLSEYGIVWLTFCAIHIVGIDAGIVLGVLVAIVEQIVTTAQTTSAVKVDRRSRAVWTPSDAKMLHDYAYSTVGGARIVTLEMHGTVFFGSSLNLLHAIMEEIGLDPDHLATVRTLATPDLVSKGANHTASSAFTLDRRSSSIISTQSVRPARPTSPPRYLVLDLSQITHLDASATRGTFLQLVKLCAKRDIVVCASGATPRIEWMFRSHGVSLDDLEDETTAKAKLLSRIRRTYSSDESLSLDKILLFVTVQEALEFCETLLLHRLQKNEGRSPSISLVDGPLERSLADVLGHVLGSDDMERFVLKDLDSTCYHDEIVLESGHYVFHRQSYPDAFYIVLSGVVANSTSSEAVRGRQELPVVSGAGLVSAKRVGSVSNLFDEGFKATNNAHRIASVTTLWQVGSVFGYNDYLMDRPRCFGAVATLDGTKVARITHSHMNLAHTSNPSLHAVLQKVLLHASTIDLANCTCHDV
jgi:CRP-like cAMP-binding protein/anti-anti-sigma regulatory factor